MIKLQREVIRGIQSAGSAAELHHYLQNAVELEHSTIPPYLTAMFSLKPGTNLRITQLLRGIVVEEMLHMSIAANILIAIGGRPMINRRAFIPQYPGPLPMNIGNGLRVGIEAFSIELVKNTFMAIEEPEDPIPVRTKALLEGAAEYATIGEFYDAIQEQIVKLGPSIFVNPDVAAQVVSATWFPPDKLFPITDPASACRAIDIIKREGEGTSVTPFEGPDDPAHFYKFGEIAAGRELVATPGGFAYAGPVIAFDPSAVWPLRPNCKIADFDVGTQARTRIEQFAYNYSALLNALHETFNGLPSRLDTAIGLMYDLRVVAVALMGTDAGGGQTVGPSFEYVQTQGGMP